MCCSRQSIYIYRVYLLVARIGRRRPISGFLHSKIGIAKIRPPLAPPSASLMPHLPGYPECRVRRSGAPPLSRYVPRRTPEVPLSAVPRRNRGAGAMYYVWGMGAGSVLDNEVLKFVQSIKLLIILLSENRPKKGFKSAFFARSASLI